MTIRRAARVVLVATSAAAFPACGSVDDGPAHPVLRFDDEPASPTFGTVELAAGAGLLAALSARADSVGWARVLSVRTEQAASAGVTQPVLGDYAVDHGTLRFVPRFPPVAGQGYRIRVDASAPAAPGLVLDTLVRVVHTPRPPDTHVVQVYPAEDPLPANLLRVYVEFSAPMSTGEAHARMRLLDADGAVVEDALLVVPQELWDPSRTRLTVLFDPGRIKTDVRPNRELGLALTPGAGYTLVIDDAWSDGDGLPLREGFRRTFVAGAIDRDVPDPATWRVEGPAAGTRDPVALTFDERLDRALLHRLLTVHDADGRPIEGRPSVERDGARWVFAPAEPWAAGGYVIRVRAELEDLAGNNLHDPFDVDRSAPHAQGIAGDSVDVPFMAH